MKAIELRDLNNLRPVWTCHTSELCKNSRSHAVAHVLVILVRLSSRHASCSHSFGKVVWFQLSNREEWATNKQGRMLGCAWFSWFSRFSFLLQRQNVFGRFMILSAGREKGIRFCSASVPSRLIPTIPKLKVRQRVALASRGGSGAIVTLMTFWAKKTHYFFLGNFFLIRKL